MMHSFDLLQKPQQEQERRLSSLSLCQLHHWTLIDCNQEMGLYNWASVFVSTCDAAFDEDNVSSSLSSSSSRHQFVMEMIEQLYLQSWKVLLQFGQILPLFIQWFSASLLHFLLPWTSCCFPHRTKNLSQSVSAILIGVIHPPKICI
jgi:hypothetical protein